MNHKTEDIEKIDVEETLRALSRRVRHIFGLSVDVESLPVSDVGALIPTHDVAAYLGVAEKTLANWRAQGRGPSFAKVGGRVAYRMSDVDAWLAQRTAIVRRQPRGRR